MRNPIHLAFAGLLALSASLAQAGVGLKVIGGLYVFVMF